MNISYGSLKSDCYVTFIKYSRIKQSAYYIGYILGLSQQYILFAFLRPPEGFMGKLKYELTYQRVPGEINGHLY